MVPGVTFGVQPVHCRCALNGGECYCCGVSPGPQFFWPGPHDTALEVCRLGGRVHGGAREPIWTPSQCLQATLFLFNVSAYKNGQCLGLFFWETSSVEALETGNLEECNRFGKGS